MKVLIVDPSLFALPYDAAFCDALAGAGVEVVLVGRPPREHETIAASRFVFLPLFYRHSERHRGAAIGKLLKGLEHARGLAALDTLVRRERPDVVHLQWLVLPLLDNPAYARLARRAPLVLTTHDSIAFHGRPSSSLQLLGHDRAVRRFAHHIAHTRHTVRQLARRGVPAERITLLPHPSLELPPAAAVAPRDGIVRILLLGALKPYKGVDVLVEAGLALARRRGDFHITIAGQPFHDLAPLEAAVAAAGATARFTFDLRFLPEADLAAQLARADLVVFPYREADASGALTLAARAGRAIVASAVGAFAEPPAAPRLRLVPPGDPDALRLALEELIREPARRERLAAASRELAAALPTWPAFAQACLEVYRGLGAARTARCAGAGLG
jgi:glycosyltransferase involved in cell wall biosynthesis